jgi:hypothetical protein
VVEVIVIKVELHSAITGVVSELGRMIIDNDGTAQSYTKGNYNVRVGRKGQDNRALLTNPWRRGRVENHSRLALSVWCLVAKALHATGYTKQAVDDTNELQEAHKQP